MKLGLAPHVVALLALGLTAITATGCSPATSPSRPASHASMPAPVVVTSAIETPASGELAHQERACDAGDVVACAHAGEAHDDGLVRVPDEARARGYLERACRADDTSVEGPGSVVAPFAAQAACSRLEQMSERRRPFERAVVRKLIVGHSKARLLRAERSPEEARKLADAAAGALDAGEPFERVADRYGSESPSMRSVDRSQEGERVVFKAKANAKRQEPAFLVPARRAVVAEDAAFGFVVWYRVR